MELRFTGPRSDLGQANLLLTEDDVTHRSVSSFSDGTRVCTYHFAEQSSSHQRRILSRVSCNQLVLHHILPPGQTAGGSTPALASSSTPFVRLSRENEFDLRLQGFALSFGSQNEGPFARIASQHHSFSSASPGVLEQIACLRVSLQLANVSSYAEERACKPSCCLFLLLQHGRLKIDASFFSPQSSSFGILCLSESANLSLKRSKRSNFAASVGGRGSKEPSLGSFVMQPRDAVVGQTELLQALELELSSNDSALWAIANFADAGSS
ncbi:hypothetical protein EX895_002516 [Sporisorium graminicola]|uniref:Uncharacterized protein n=1 Tax=Sporisorium graminicola TaxID=280036 RepID=A0A4U7KYM8_9BASI|nr:hypothetical protein EX895_002516 [Sporisorium graminicola]TKY88528.1 hypothetical protein EX895_002516 [Sporisorium graminicola]